MDVELQQRHASEVKRHFLRNYLCLSFEGGLFGGALAFVMPQTVLPAMINMLNGPTWLIAIVPMMMTYGFLAPPLFMAHRIERMEHMKPILVFAGVFQRVPYLIAGLILLLPSAHFPLLVLGVVALTPLMSGCAGGISLTAFQELVAKTIPAHRLSSMWAIRSVVGAVISILAGTIVAAVLRAHPGMTGFGILHLIAFAFLVISFVVFVGIRETYLPPKRAADDEARWVDFLRAIPSTLRGDRNLRRYVLSRVCTSGINITIPFLSIRALTVLNDTGTFLGYIVMAQAAGSIFGNLVGGYSGDRYGSKRLLIASSIGYVFTCVFAVVAGTQMQFAAVFFFLGVFSSLDNIGAQSLSAQISPVRNRIAYMAIMSMTSMTGITLISILAVLIQKIQQPFLWQTAISSLLMIAALGLIRPVTAAAHGLVTPNKELDPTAK